MSWVVFYTFIYEVPVGHYHITVTHESITIRVKLLICMVHVRVVSRRMFSQPVITLHLHLHLVIWQTLLSKATYNVYTFYIYTDGTLHIRSN